MVEQTPMLLELARYAELIRGRLERLCVHEPRSLLCESAAAVQVERGVVFPTVRTSERSLLTPVERLVELSMSSRLAEVAVVDAAGHHRSVHLPLLVYAWLQTYRKQFETLSRQQFGQWEDALRSWCELLEAELTTILWPPGPIAAAQGDRIGEAAWTALALSAAGEIFHRDAWTDLASDTFGRLARSQTVGGAFLSGTAADNPEPLWYHELVILHAAASYAVQAEDRPLSDAVQRATLYHQNETQPDHASSQPWGLFAFIWNAATRGVADQLLHASQIQQSSGLDGVSLILLADALYCLELFLGPSTPSTRS
jgi:hypothetical protein